MRILVYSNQDKEMLAHFMLFSEADIEYRFLMATNELVKEDTTNQLYKTSEGGHIRKTARFHKVSLGLVSAKSKKQKKGKTLTDHFSSFITLFNK